MKGKTKPVRVLLDKKHQAIVNTIMSEMLQDPHNLERVSQNTAVLRALRKYSEAQNG